jgi:glycosyltransferase involved in cell wall biosynthesis
MHAGLIIYGGLESISGGYLYDRKLVEGLRLAGDRVDVISLRTRNYVRHLGDNWSTAFFRRLRGFQGDLLLQDELNHPSLFWMNRRLRRVSSIPIFSIVHHLRSMELRPAWQNTLYRQVERRYLETVDGHIFNSQTTRRSVQGAGIDLSRRANLVALPAGDHFELASGNEPGPDLIRQRAVEPGPLRLVFVGNLIPRKGLHTLLEAAARLPPGCCRITVIGNPQADPVYTRRIRHSIARLGLDETVQMLGLVSAERLAEELACHHVQAVPSSYEGYGIVYLEGMRFGLPALATTGGAAAEIITHGANGFLAAPGDAEGMAALLAGLAADRAQLTEMSLAARERYLSQPTWSDTALSIRRFLLDCLAGTGPNQELGGRIIT